MGGQEVQDAAVDEVGALHVQEVAGVVDDLDLGPLGHEVERRPHGRQQHALVVAPVQIERRLRRGQQRRRLLVGELGHLQRRVPHGAVVADGRHDALGVADGLLHPRHVPRPVVARRPVAPEVPEKGVVVERQRRLGQGGEEEEHVPALLELRVGEQRHADGGRGRHGRRDGAPPALGLVRHRAVGGQGAPVVADQDGVVAAAEDLVQRVGVLHQGAHLVAPVGRQRRRGVAPQERRHGPVTRGRQFRKEIAPGMCRVGEAVQAEGERPVVRPVGQAGEFQPVRGDVLHERRTYCAGAG